MARPKKIGLDYFPLDVELNDQVQAIEAVHGNDGFTWIVKFWQASYKTNDGIVDLSGLLGDVFASRCRITTDKQQKIITDCKTLKLIKEISDGIFFSEGVRKRINTVIGEREKSLFGKKPQLFAGKPPENPSCLPENPQTMRQTKQNKTETEIEIEKKLNKRQNKTEAVFSISHPKIPESIIAWLRTELQDDPELTGRVLLRCAHSEPLNPAGWLVKGIRAGGYAFKAIELETTDPGFCRKWIDKYIHQIPEGK